MDEFWEIMPFFTVFFAFYGFLILFALAAYVLRGLGIMRMSGALGFRNGWLGFIPYANLYQFGRMGGELEFGSRRVRNPGLWMLLVPLISGAAGMVVYFVMVFAMFGSIAAAGASPFGHSSDSQMFSMISGMMIGYFLFFLVIYAAQIIVSIIRMMVLYRIYSCFYDSTRAVTTMLISAFVPLAEGILLMRVAKQPVMRPPMHSDYPWYPAPAYGQPQPPADASAPYAAPGGYPPPQENAPPQQTPVPPVDGRPPYKAPDTASSPESTPGTAPQDKETPNQ